MDEGERAKWKEVWHQLQWIEWHVFDSNEKEEEKEEWEEVEDEEKGEWMNQSARSHRANCNWFALCKALHFIHLLCFDCKRVEITVTHKQKGKTSGNEFSFSLFYPMTSS